MRYFVCVFVLLITLNSCVGLLVGTGAAVGGKMFMQDKTLGESISDTTIWTKIRAGFVRESVDGLLGSVNIEVSEGRVLLTGFVDNAEDILKILKVVWEQDGVKEVINEIKVKNQENNPNVFDYAKDTWTTTQIKTKLLFAKGVNSTNYNIETINSIVYIFGIASDETALETVKKISSEASNVKKVVSYVRVRKILDSRLEDTKGYKPTAEQEHLDIEALEGEVSDEDIFETDNF